MNSRHSTPSVRLSLACAAALVTVAAIPAGAQLEPTPTIPPASPTAPTTPATPLPGERYPENTAVPMPNRKAERFISKVSMLHSEESRLSTIAQQRAANEQLRQLAQQVHDDSQRREAELAQLAQTRSVVLPTGRESGDMAEENQEWRAKDPEDFDKDYVNRLIRIQKNAIDALEDYANDNDADAELSAYAQKHLPVLRESLRQAESLENQID